MSTLSLRLHLLLRSSSKPKALQIFAGASTSLSYEGRPATICILYQKITGFTSCIHSLAVLTIVYICLPWVCNSWRRRSLYVLHLRVSAESLGPLDVPSSTLKLMENSQTLVKEALPPGYHHLYLRCQSTDNGRLASSWFIWPLKLPSEGSADLRATWFHNNNGCIGNNWKEALELETCVVVHHPLLQSRPQGVTNSAKCQWLQFPHPMLAVQGPPQDSECGIGIPVRHRQTLPQGMEPSNGLGTLGEAIGLGRGRKAEKTWKKHGNLPDEYIYSYN